MNYTVQKGDTLYKLAKANNTTVDAIAKANGIHDPGLIRVGATLRIPGQNQGIPGNSKDTGSGSAGGSGNPGGSQPAYNKRGTQITRVNYGTGQYGNQYTGSNTNAAYSNMENPPGSAGYEWGTIYTNVYNEEGKVVGKKPVEGVLPLGTNFVSYGAMPDTYTGSKETNGIFTKAKGREYGMLNHVSGYSGMGYRDNKGNFYTADGALLREDGTFYEPGATISANGMYQDTGSGYGKAAWWAATGSPGAWIYTKSGSYGNAPGTRTVFSTGDDFFSAQYPLQKEGNAADQESSLVDDFVRTSNSQQNREEDAVDKENALYLEQLYAGY